MNVAAVVIVSVVAAILLVLLVAGMGAMIFLHLKTQKAIVELQTAIAEFAGESKTLIEGARSSFTGIRQDIKAAQDSQSKAIGIVLKKHETAIEDLIGKFNGKAIEIAAYKITGATAKVERVVGLLNQLVMDRDVIQPNDLGAEEYAPSDTIYGTRSEAARLDDAVMEEEAAEMEPMYSNGLGE